MPVLLFSESMAELLNSPISKHKGSQISFLNLVTEHYERQSALGHNLDDPQISFLNLVAEHYERQSALGHNLDDQYKIANVRFLTIMALNLNETLAYLKNLNANTGKKTQVTWDQYMPGIYEQATSHDLKHQREAKSTTSSTRKVFSGEMFRDAIESNEYESDDDVEDDLCTGFQCCHREWYYHHEEKICKEKS